MGNVIFFYRFLSIFYVFCYIFYFDNYGNNKKLVILGIGVKWPFKGKLLGDMWLHPKSVSIDPQKQ